MRKSSIHFEHNKEVKVGYFYHNSREKPTANSIFSTQNNYCNIDGKTAMENFFNELKKRELEYTKRTGKKLHKNTIRHISAIVNLEEHHTKEDIEKVIKYLENLLDTKVIQYSIHKDEGHIDEETKQPVVNYHAHLELIGLDSKGNSIRRKLDRKTLIKIQENISKILNMQRGINYTKERKKRLKRLNTYEYKEYARRKTLELKPVLQENKRLKKENEELKLFKKQLEKEISELRKKMIEYNKMLENQNKEKEFTQEDYKYLSKLKKDINANNLKEIYEKLENYTKQVNERIKQLQEENLKLKQENQEFIDLIIKPENINSISELEKELYRQNEYNEEKLDNTKKITNRNEYIINYLFEYETFDNLQEKNEEFENKIKTYKKLNNEYFYTDYRTNIEEYRDKLYLMKVLNKRIDFLMKKLKELNKKLEILTKKIINKLEQNNPGYAKFLTKKLFKNKEQKDNQIKQTNYSRPKL